MRSKTCSILVGDVFRLVELVRQDMIRGGYCFVSERRSGDLQPRDYLYLINDQSLPLPNQHVSCHKKLETMELTSHHLRAYFQRERFHPKERYFHLYSSLPPKLVLTYEWSTSFHQLRKYLNKDNMYKHSWTAGQFSPAPSDFFVFLFRIMFCLNMCIQSPTSPPVQIDTCPMWLDILFNDQNAVDIKAELKQAERIYLYAKHHLVIATSSVLLRAWCLFEIMTRLKSFRQRVSILHDWSVGATPFAHAVNVFDEMQASYPLDKDLIRSEILSKFGSKAKFQAAVDKIIQQSADMEAKDIFGRCYSVFVNFISVWMVVAVLAPVLLLFAALSLLILSLQESEYDRMFPPGPSVQDTDPESGVVVVQNP
jgi:hypothetical protein